MYSDLIKMTYNKSIKVPQVLKIALKITQFLNKIDSIVAIKQVKDVHIIIIMNKNKNKYVKLIIN